MKFIGTLLIIIFIFWLIGKILSRFWPNIVMWLLKRQMRRQMDQAFSHAQSHQQREYDPFGYYRSQQAQANKRHRRHGKKIDPSVGEYVEFEEISITTASTHASQAPFPSEPQIEDADWEEIK